MRKANVKTLAIFALAFGIAAFALGPSPVVAATKKVLIIGIDGFRVDAMKAVDTPHLDKLIASGTFTDSAIAGGMLGTPTQQPTYSGPGWTTITTGYWSDVHRVTGNSFQGYDSEAAPHFFKRLRAAGPNLYLSSIVQWPQINSKILAQTDVTANHQLVVNTGQAVEDATVEHLQNESPDVFMIHFDDVDHAGHHTGFGPDNPEYVKAVEKTDAHIGVVISALESRPSYDQEDWLIVVTTDHGGTGTNHGGQSAVERKIFIIASGGDVPKGKMIPRGPGQVAIVPTVFKHLELPVDPAWNWAPPFAYPPYYAAGFEALADSQAMTVELSWTAPEEANLDGIHIERNGEQIASLAPDATAFTDQVQLPETAALHTYNYTLHQYGGTDGGAAPVLEARASFYNGPSPGAAIKWSDGKAFFFSGNRYTRYDMSADKADSGYPKAIDNRTWPGLGLETVDAALEWNNGKAFLFSGNRYVRYDIESDRADQGYPLAINSGTWPGLEFETVDAAVNWGNGKAFFFSGNRYVRYDIEADRADPGYPKSINSGNWPGLGFETIDAAVNWGNGKAFFFSGGRYVRYDIASDKADPGYPKPVDSASWPGL